MATEITSDGFDYDENGNLASDGNFDYEYNSANQLVKVINPSDSSIVATYEYDYNGLRIAKTTASGTVRYHWDGSGNLVRESDANNNTLAQYIYSGKDKLIAIEKAGKIYYTHTNYRGDIVAITDENKNIVATYKYDPWGTPIPTGQTNTFDQPFRYSGYYFDTETGMYYLKARYYNPELGRFMTKDTVKGVNADPKTLNLYAYCGGNPVMFVDPSGTSALSTVGVAFGIAGIIATFAALIFTSEVWVTAAFVVGVGTLIFNTLAWLNDEMKDGEYAINQALTIFGLGKFKGVNAKVYQTMQHEAACGTGSWGTAQAIVQPKDKIDFSKAKRIFSGLKKKLKRLVKYVKNNL